MVKKFLEKDGQTLQKLLVFNIIAYLLSMQFVFNFSYLKYCYVDVKITSLLNTIKYCTKKKYVCCEMQALHNISKTSKTPTNLKS